MKILIISSRKNELESVFSDLEVVWLDRTDPDMTLDVLKCSTFSAVLVDDLSNTSINHEILAFINKEIPKFPCFAISSHDTFPPINPFYCFTLEGIKKEEVGENLRLTMKRFKARNDELQAKVDFLSNKTIEEITIREENDLITTWTELAVRIPGFKDQSRPVARKINETLDKILKSADKLIEKINKE